MPIETISFPTPMQKQEIRELLDHCSRIDGETYEIEFDENFRREGEFNTFLFRLSGEVVAVLNLFTPGTIECEISAYTHPAHRRSGILRQLMETAREELMRRGYREILFVIPGDSNTGSAAAARFGAILSHAEYVMQLDNNLYQRQTPDHGEMTIRQAGMGDRPELLRLAGLSFGDSPEDGERYLEGTLGVPGRSVHIARVDGTLTGMVSMIHGEQKFYIHGLSVFPDFQKRGIGGALLRHKVEEALAVDPEKPVELEVATENPRALALYKRAGFRVVKHYDYHRLSIAG